MHSWILPTILCSVMFVMKETHSSTSHYRHWECIALNWGCVWCAACGLSLIRTQHSFFIYDGSLNLCKLSVTQSLWHQRLYCILCWCSWWRDGQCWRSACLKTTPVQRKTSRLSGSCTTEPRHIAGNSCRIYAIAFTWIHSMCLNGYLL